MYGIRTLKPGSVAGADGLMQAPHIVVAVFMRGLLRPVITRIYFADIRDSGPTRSRLDPRLGATDDGRLAIRRRVSFRHPPPGRTGDRIL